MASSIKKKINSHLKILIKFNYINCFDYNNLKKQ